MMNKLAFAIQMEIDGEQYYLKQAGKHPETALQRAFMLLAKAESGHAALLKSRMAAADRFQSASLPQEESANLFANKDDFLREAEVLPGQLEVFTFALDMEQKSIDLYQGMLADAADEPTRQLLSFLVRQEQEHYALFDELAALLRKPRDWVEAAEFNPRKEY